MKLKSILALTITFLVSLSLLIGSYAIFNPIKLAKEKEKALAEIKVMMSDATDFTSNPLETIDGVEILLSAKVYKGSEGIGYVYEANAKNGFGNIKIMIAVGLDEKISDLKMIELNQTMYQDKTTKLLQDYKYQKLSPSIADQAAGATSVSMNTLMDMFSALGSHHAKVEKFPFVMPYEAFYGEYTIASSTTSNVSGAAVKVEVINGASKSGKVISLTKAGVYQTGSLTEKEIMVQVALDETGKILGVLLPNESYKHSLGNFYAKALVYAQSFKDMMINEVPDAYTGSTNDEGEPNNSKMLIHELMLIAGEVFLG